MSGQQQYGRYPQQPGSFPPPPGAARSSGTPGTGGFAVPPPGGPPSGASGNGVSYPPSGYPAPPGGPSSSNSYGAQQPPAPSRGSAYPGGYGAAAPSALKPPQVVPASSSNMYVAPPPQQQQQQQQQQTMSAVTSGMNRMNMSSNPYGTAAPLSSTTSSQQGQLNPNPHPPSPFYQPLPGKAQLSRFQPGSQTGPPPPAGGHDPFAPAAASAYPPQQQQMSQQPPVMGGQFHPGGPRPLAVQPVSTTGPGGEFRHAMAQPPTATAAAAPIAGGAQTFMEENVDWNIQHPKEMLQFTTTQIPQSAQLSSSSKVVLGGLLRPLAICPNEVPTITPGPAGIVRCKKCRTYVNAFVSWFENGRRWRCNICGQPNDCPSGYFCHLGDNNERKDKFERPELSLSVVEYLAPAEYMVRPPPPPAYFFVLDVSAQAVSSGMLAHVAEAIKAALFGSDDVEGTLPGGERTQIGFLTYDTSVQYFNLSKRGRSGKDESTASAQPQMLVVADLNELFVPLPPEDLLVNLEEHKDSVEAFLDALPTMFSSSNTLLQQESCLGPALKAAFTIMKPIGGKMLVFDTMLPTLPFDGQLKIREANPRVMGTDAETALLRGQSTWYKDTAVEFSRAQISVDLFLTNYSYIDVATLSDLSKYTAGNLYTFPNFSSTQDGARMEAEIFHTLVRPTALEAVMRVRCTRGLRVNNFYGNFFIRGSDLLALPNCSTESVFGFTIVHEDPICPSNVLTFQSALLYTSTNGERRIRVLTTALPVSPSLTQITQSVHADVYCNLLSKQGVEYALKNGVGAARSRLLQSCVDVIKTCRTASQKASAEDKGIPVHLELMPIMIMGLLKNTAFRGGTDVHPDERCASFNLISNLWVDERGKAYFYPRMFRVDQMQRDAGLPIGDTNDSSSEVHFMHTEVSAGEEKIRLPFMMDLTVERLSSEGIYCLENGQDAFLWVGRQADPSLLQDLFGVDSLENIDYSQITLRTEETDIASRLNAILTALQADTHGSPRVIVIREAQDEYLERKFLWHLIEDKAQFEHGTYTYQEFMEWIIRNTSSSATGFGGGAPLPGGSMPPSYMASGSAPGAPRAPSPQVLQPGQRQQMMPPPPQQQMMHPPHHQQMMPPQQQQMMPPPQQQMMPPPQQQQMMPPPQQQQMMPPPQKQQMMPPPQQQMMPPPQQQMMMQPGQTEMRGPQQQVGGFPPPPGRFATPPVAGPPAATSKGPPSSFGTQLPGPPSSFGSKGIGAPPPMPASGPPSFNASAGATRMPPPPPAGFSR